MYVVVVVVISKYLAQLLSHRFLPDGESSLRMSLRKRSAGRPPLTPPSGPSLCGARGYVCHAALGFRNHNFSETQINGVIVSAFL